MGKSISLRLSDEEENILKERAQGNVSGFIKGLITGCNTTCNTGVTPEPPDCNTCDDGDCNDCSLGKRLNEKFEEGYKHAESDTKAEIAKLQEQLRALEVERNCNNCQQITMLTRQVDDLTHDKINAPDCDSCARIAGLEKQLAECEETITVSADCSTCSKAAELSRALLDNADLRQRIEEMQTFPASAPAVQDCGACDKLSAVVSEREKMEKERDAAKSKHRGIVEKYESLESQYRQAQSEAARLRDEMQDKETALQESETTTAEKLKKLSASLDKYKEVLPQWEQAYNRKDRLVKILSFALAGSLGIAVGVLLWALI